MAVAVAVPPFPRFPEPAKPLPPNASALTETAHLAGDGSRRGSGCRGGGVAAVAGVFSTLDAESGAAVARCTGRDIRVGGQIDQGSAVAAGASGGGARAAASVSAVRLDGCLQRRGSILREDER